MPPSPKRYYSIQVVAQTLGVHPQAIRLYEREGLITSVRSGKERYYSTAQIERLRVIVQLRQELGINLAGIEVILDMRERLLKLQQLMAELHSPRTPEPIRPPAPPRIPVKEET